MDRDYDWWLEHCAGWGRPVPLTERPVWRRCKVCGQPDPDCDEYGVCLHCWSEMTDAEYQALIEEAC